MLFYLKLQCLLGSLINLLGFIVYFTGIEIKKIDDDMKRVSGLVLFIMCLISCSSTDQVTFQFKPANLKGEYIYRQHHENLFKPDSATKVERAAYPWEEGNKGKYPKITKEFFRCKGSSLNPVRLISKEKEILRFYDCGGSQRHSLPLKDQKEFIYPILIDLLNYLQNKTGRRVVITSGHCCPDHNLYLDSSQANQVSKHLLGAEVDFYVQGLENQPNQVIDLILAYYKQTAKYKNLKDFEEFKRYEKGDGSSSTLPWYNKEIFVKLYKKEEGRDFDNRHPYPYISIQVRYDWDLQEKIQYSWEKAFHNFHRW